MINPITNRKILFFGRDIPVEKLPKINNRNFLHCGENTPSKVLEEGTFLSDCEGAIQKVVFTINSEDFTEVKAIIEKTMSQFADVYEVHVYAAGSRI